MRPHQKYRQRGKRRWRLEFALFAPGAPGRQRAEEKADSWIGALTDAEFAQMLGPSWAAMTERQRRLYPDLPDEEMARLWGDSEEDHRDIA